MPALLTRVDLRLDSNCLLTFFSLEYALCWAELNDCAPKSDVFGGLLLFCDLFLLEEARAVGDASFGDAWLFSLKLKVSPTFFFCPSAAVDDFYLVTSFGLSKNCHSFDSS